MQLADIVLERIPGDIAVAYILGGIAQVIVFHDIARPFLRIQVLPFRGGLEREPCDFGFTGPVFKRHANLARALGIERNRIERGEVPAFVAEEYAGQNPSVNIIRSHQVVLSVEHLGLALVIRIERLGQNLGANRIRAKIPVSGILHVFEVLHHDIRVVEISRALGRRDALCYIQAIFSSDNIEIKRIVRRERRERKRSFFVRLRQDIEAIDTHPRILFAGMERHTAHVVRRFLELNRIKRGNLLCRKHLRISGARLHHREAVIARLQGVNDK